MAEALRSAGRWVGCEEVAVGEVVPTELGNPLRAALQSLSAADSSYEAHGALVPTLRSR
jgi:hypothetical protein